MDLSSIYYKYSPKFDLTQRSNQIGYLNSIHPQTRQINFITRNSTIKLTGLWVNPLQRNYSIKRFCELKTDLELAAGVIGSLELALQRMALSDYSLLDIPDLPYESVIFAARISPGSRNR